MIFNKKPNDRVAVALILCFCVLAIASVFTMRNSLEQMKFKDDNKINIAQEDKDKNLDTKVVKRVPTVDSAQNQSGSQKAKTDGSTISYLSPINGKVTVGYSNTEQVYSKTLDQYMVHKGIDFSAPLNTPVVAIADGTVTKVYSDDKLGLSIEILHPEGITSKYSNLKSTQKVGIGDVVKQGDSISTVGNSALFESADTPHLHFEILKDGQSINPTDFVKIH